MGDTATIKPWPPAGCWPGAGRPSWTSTTITATAPRTSSTIHRKSCSPPFTRTPMSPTPASAATVSRGAAARAWASTTTSRCPRARTRRPTASILAQALEAIRAFRPDFLVVSLGVDTVLEDPVGGLQLPVESFPGLGGMIGYPGGAGAGRPGGRLQPAAGRTLRGRIPDRVGRRAQPGRCASMTASRILPALILRMVKVIPMTWILCSEAGVPLHSCRSMASRLPSRSGRFRFSF